MSAIDKAQLCYVAGVFTLVACGESLAMGIYHLALKVLA